MGHGMRKEELKVGMAFHHITDLNAERPWEIYKVIKKKLIERDSPFIVRIHTHVGNKFGRHIITFNDDAIKDFLKCIDTGLWIRIK